MPNITSDTVRIIVTIVTPSILASVFVVGSIWEVKSEQKAFESEVRSELKSIKERQDRFRNYIDSHSDKIK